MGVYWHVFRNKSLPCAKGGGTTCCDGGIVQNGNVQYTIDVGTGVPDGPPLLASTKSRLLQKIEYKQPTHFLYTIQLFNKCRDRCPRRSAPCVQIAQNVWSEQFCHRKSTKNWANNQWLSAFSTFGCVKRRKVNKQVVYSGQTKWYNCGNKPRGNCNEHNWKKNCKFEKRKTTETRRPCANAWRKPTGRFQVGK